MAPIYHVETSIEKAEALKKLGFNLIEHAQIADLDRSNWVVIPYDFTKGKYSLEISPERISYNSAVEKVGKELKINYKNSSKDSLGREFVGNNNWSDSLKLNLTLGLETPCVEDNKDYLKLLYLGSQDKIKVYDVSGKQLDSKLCEKYLLDSIGVMSPWRAEWLDADFKLKDNQLYINYNHKLDEKRNLIPKNSEILDKNTLMTDKTSGISLDDYILKNHTNQGFPNKKVKSGDLYYWYPRSDNNSVARFGADSIRADLDCGRGPSDRGANLGVRAAKQRE